MTRPTPSRRPTMTAPDTPTQHPDDRDKHGTTEDRARRNLSYWAALQAHYEGRDA